MTDDQMVSIAFAVVGSIFFIGLFSYMIVCAVLDYKSDKKK